MGILKYIKQKKELQDILIEFIENLSPTDQDFEHLIDFIKTQKYPENKEELEYFLRLLLNISDNYHRYPDFFTKIKKIILCFAESIKTNLSNQEIFDIFNNCRPIFLFLIQNQLFEFNNYLLDELGKSKKYYHFLFPEIKGIIDKKTKKQIKKELLEHDPYIFEHFDEKRQIGENDSYICSLIREDNAEEFISYTNRKNLQLSSNVPDSFFETNSSLLASKPTIIEYAAFFGSIQIFQYLRMNDVSLTPSLWIYAVHSKNAELIHLLEECQVESDDSYESCLCESIKCHHNEFVNYIKNNLVDPLVQESDRRDLILKVYESSIQYSNYSYFPIDYSMNPLFFNLCLYKYSSILKLYLEKKKDEFEFQIIFELFFFNQVL